MQTHRAYMGADTAITCWVRQDGDKRSLTGHTLTVHMFPYGSSVELGETIDATSAEAGKVAFTVTEELADRYLKPGAYRMAVESNTAGVVYDGILEVV